MQNQNQKQVVVLDLEFAQAVVNYLQTKPFGEVAGFMQVFSQAKARPARPEDMSDFPLAPVGAPNIEENGHVENVEIKPAG